MFQLRTRPGLSNTKHPGSGLIRLFLPVILRQTSASSTIVQLVSIKIIHVDDEFQRISNNKKVNTNRRSKRDLNVLTNLGI